MFDSFKKRRKEKLEDKKLLKEMEEEEKELNKDIPDDKYGIKELFSVLKGKSEEDIEYESYLTDEEKENLIKEKKQNKKILIIASSVMCVVIIAVSIGLNIFVKVNQSDLYKVTEPILEEYYKSKYGTKLKTSSIEEITYKNDNNEEASTGIYLLTTKDGNHIMSLNNELIGDDISISSKNETIKSTLDNLVSSDYFISSEIETSYKDYYIEFNRFIDYIDVLPNMTADDLITSGKLTVTYKMFYQNNGDLTDLINYIQNFSDDSKFVFIHLEAGLPNKIMIVDKNSTISLNITASITKADNVIYEELDINNNSINELNISNVTSSSITSLGEYDIKNGMLIEVEKEYSRDKELPSYYLLRFTNNCLNKSNIVQIDTSKYSSNYQELEVEDYQDIIFMEMGSNTYLLATDEVFIGSITSKSSFWCNLGLC